MKNTYNKFFDILNFTERRRESWINYELRTVLCLTSHIAYRISLGARRWRGFNQIYADFDIYHKVSQRSLVSNSLVSNSLTSHISKSHISKKVVSLQS